MFQGKLISCPQADLESQLFGENFLCLDENQMMLDENVMRGKAVDFTETTMSASIKKQERSQHFQQPEIVLLQTTTTNKLEQKHNSLIKMCNLNVYIQLFV